MGYNAEKHTELLHIGVADGHEIGNHTLTHKDLAFQTVAGIEKQLGEAKQKIDELSGQDTRLFRPRVVSSPATPPTSVPGSATTSCCGPPSSPSHRGRARTSSATTPISRFGNGHILAMHDGIGAGTFDRKAAFARELAEKREDEIKALPAILEAALDEGYTFVTASELMAAGGIAEPGAHVPG